MKKITHGSLFSGGGGFDLAAQWMGYENLFHCEWMPFPRYILDYHFPESESFINIITTDFKKYANKIDILTGGFPCQPFSLAGKRKGTDDERYLWHEMLRAVQEIKPKCVIAENVYGLVNIDGGLVFESVCLDLENEGYEVQPFIIPACAKNAPHRRDRVWIVAYSRHNPKRSARYSNSNERSQFTALHEKGQKRKCQTVFDFGLRYLQRYATNSNGNGFDRRNGNNEIDASKTRFDAQRYIESRNVDGDFADTDSTAITGKLFRQPREGELDGCNCENDATDPENFRFPFSKKAERKWGKYITYDRQKIRSASYKFGRSWATTNPDSRRQSGKEYRQTEPQWTAKESVSDNWENFPTQSPICGGDDGISDELDGTAFLKTTGKKIRNFKSYHRSESIKLYGNAIVPQVAMEIFKALETLMNNEQ